MINTLYRPTCICGKHVIYGIIEPGLLRFIENYLCFSIYIYRIETGLVKHIFELYNSLNICVILV